MFQTFKNPVRNGVTSSIAKYVLCGRFGILPQSKSRFEMGQPDVFRDIQCCVQRGQPQHLSLGTCSNSSVETALSFRKFWIDSRPCFPGLVISYNPVKTASALKRAMQNFYQLAVVRRPATFWQHLRTLDTDPKEAIGKAIAYFH